MFVSTLLLAGASDLAPRLDLILLLLCIIAVVGFLATRFKLPFPLLLVVAGIVIAAIPQLPNFELDPELVFILFLPPLLYSSGLLFPWVEFRRYFKPIMLLAVGLVLATTVSVALVAWWLVPGITLAAAFVLGAVVSPPDAVAANSILERQKVPGSVRGILEGESLVNDAVGLVAYQFAIAAVVTGAFSFSEAGLTLIWVALGGLGWGLLAGFGMGLLHRQVADPSIQITLSFITPWLAYLPAERMGASGVLAVVAAAMYIGFRARVIFSAQSRLQGRATWGFFSYVLNATVFLLIGLEFPVIWDAVSKHPSFTVTVATVAVIFTVVVVRFAWVYLISEPLSRLLRLPYVGDVRLERKVLAVISWTGMRGVVSLAAALAIPLLTESGEAFPARNTILFITIMVILFTLLVQGGLLPLLIRLLKMRPEADMDERENEARIRILQGAIEDIERFVREGRLAADDPTVVILLDHYQTRLRGVERRTGLVGDLAGSGGRQTRFFGELELLSLERLERLRKEDFIDDEVTRRIEFDLDTDHLRIRRLIRME